MSILRNKRILLGVSGGIAAYKTPELVRRLKDAGADVQVVLTSAGSRFVSALSLQVVSEHPVGQALWQTRDDGADSRINHTDLGKDVDLIILAPATANLLARVRHGFADDLLTTTIMACRTPVLICPSMNTDMLANPLVQSNITALKAPECNGRYTFLQSGVGLLACGVTGPGRLPDPPDIIEAAAACLKPKSLQGIRITVSAGPTREAVDPVRFLTNHATGTMGLALARSLAACGAQVTVVAGPGVARTPAGIHERIDVVSAADMAEAIAGCWQHTDVLIMSAAVADFRPVKAATDKIKKREDGQNPALQLSRTRDILLYCSTLPDRGDKMLIGFAAETRDIQMYAAAKLKRKGLDFIIANDVSAPGVGFGRGDNAVSLLSAQGVEVDFARAPKWAIAEGLTEALVPAFRARFGEAKSND